jgi:hypothetical protein
MAVNKQINPRMMVTLFRDRNCQTVESSSGSGSANSYLRLGSSEELVKLFGLKQYCWKHCVQNEERDRGGTTLYRARSIAAHCMHLPKFGSAELVLGTKPPMTFACVWSRKSWVCIIE